MSAMLAEIFKIIFSMRKSVYLILLATVSFMNNSLQAQPAMFGVNPQHTGVYDSSLPSDILLSEKWKFKTDGMIFSSAVVSNDVIYFGSDDSCLYAIDTAGTEKWKFKSNGMIRSTPAVVDTVVYFNNYGAKFYAVNTKSGQEMWSFDTDGESPRTGKGLNWCTPKDMVMTDPWDFYLASPVIADTLVYFGSGANVYAINLKNNEMVWKYTAPNVVHSSPAVYNGIIYFGCWDSKIYALNTITGKEIWSFQTGLDAENHGMEGIQSSPSVIDTLVIIGSRDANVYALHAKTGNVIWKTSFGGTWMPSSYAYFNETLFTGSSEGGGLKALSILNGKLKYAASKNFYLTFSTPAIASETAFIGCMNGSLFAVDVNTGKIKCRFDTDGRISDPLNAILDEGNLNPAVFNPVSGTDYEQAVEYVRRVLTAGSVLATPAIDKNTVYFGSSDSCLYAVHDDGTCKPEFRISNSKIELGETSAWSIDTAIYVRNIGDCPDSVCMYSSGSVALLTKSLVIQPSRFVVFPNDSVKVHIVLNTSDLNNDKAYTATIGSKSIRNPYYYFETVLSFKTPALSGITQSEGTRSDVLYPNPFKSSVLIKYFLEQNCFVEIRIYNSLGQLVNVLISQNQDIGEHKVIWDGNNREGIKLNPGSYFCSIVKGNSIVTKEVLFIE